MRPLYGLLAVPVFALALLAAPNALPTAADVIEACPSPPHLARIGLPMTLDFSLGDGWTGTAPLEPVHAAAAVWDSGQESLTCTYDDRPNHPEQPANTYYKLVKSFSGRECQSNGATPIAVLTCAR